MKKLLLLPILGLLLVYACNDAELQIGEHVPNLPSNAYDYVGFLDDLESFVLPDEVTFGDQNIVFGEHNNVVGGASLTTHFNDKHNAEATLGRVLFYDNRMSKNNSIACASCHRQNLAFSDDVAVSSGFGGQLTTRNSSSIVNPMFGNTFFWDGRSRSLEDLALRPVFDHVEMGMDSEADLIQKLAREDYYQALFKDAYGSPAVTGDGIRSALAAFVSSMFSGDSKFDDGTKNDFAEFSQLERHGMALFFSEQTQCASCHSGINFASPSGIGNEYQQTSGTTNIGLDVVYDDPGFSDGKFKIPSIRNAALTAPYMHDGRFETLREVIDHYNEGVQPHTDLDRKLTINGSPIRMNLTELDKDALVAFVSTLTSKSLLVDEKYSNPFK
jgi:cytochrome c peroxidase